MTKDNIIEIVCEACEIRREYLANKGKQGRQISIARHLIAHYLWSRLRFSIRQASQVVGVSPQTLYEVIFPFEIQSRRQSDPEFNEICSLIDSRISQSACDDKKPTTALLSTDRKFSE